MDLNQHSVILFLKTIPKDELQSLRKFIASPYFNTNENVTKIFEEIIKFYPEFKSQNLTKQFIFKKIFKDKTFSDSNFRWMLSIINHLIENFFSQKRFDNDEYAKLRYLTAENFANVREEPARKAVHAMEKLLSKDKYKGHMYFFYKYIYYTNELSLDVIFKNDKKLKDADYTIRIFSKAIIAYINHFIMGVAYDYLNVDLTNSKYHKNGIHKRLNEIMKALDLEKLSEFIKNDNEDNLDIEADMKIFSMFVYRENDTLYGEFKEYLVKNEKDFLRENTYEYYSKMISYCWLKILNSVKEDFYRKELFELANTFLDRKYYKTQSVPWIPHTLFRIFVLNWLSMGKIESAKIFIDTYLDDVYPQQRENAGHYGKALIEFYEKDFDNSLSHLSKIDGTFYNTDQKALRILLFIEKGFYHPCETEIKSFKKFLKTNFSLSEEIKKGYENFLFFVTHILKEYQGKAELAPAKLRKKLKETARIYYRDWIEFKLK